MAKRISTVIFLSVLALAGCNKGQSTDGLIDDVNSSDELDRIKAVRLLQNRKEDASKVVPVLIECLKDKSVNIRLSAAIGLGYFGEDATTAVPALEAAQKDKDAKVREAASVAISRIKD